VAGIGARKAQDERHIGHNPVAGTEDCGPSPPTGDLTVMARGEQSGHRGSVLTPVELFGQRKETSVTTQIDGIEHFQTLVGQHLGYSEYFRVTQEQVDLFADATGDHQWIHVDPERAKAGPFGQTIAHGYLTLSLLPVLLGQIVRVNGVSMGINYGANKVRFPSPVPVGSELRAGASVASVEDVTGGIQVVLDVTVEIRDAAKPSCAAQIVTRYYR
jgi:acyl dehydratase